DRVAHSAEMPVYGGLIQAVVKDQLADVCTTSEGMEHITVRARTTALITATEQRRTVLHCQQGERSPFRADRPRVAASVIVPRRVVSGGEARNQFADVHNRSAVYLLLQKSSAVTEQVERFAMLM